MIAMMPWLSNAHYAGSKQTRNHCKSSGKQRQKWPGWENVPEIWRMTTQTHMVIFSLSRPLIIRHPGCAPSSCPSTRYLFMRTRGRSAIALAARVLPAGFTGRSLTSRRSVSRWSPQSPLPWHRILGDGLRHDRDLIEIRGSPRMRRWSGVATRERAKLVLRYMVKSRLLLGQAGKNLRCCSIAFRLSR